MKNILKNINFLCLLGIGFAISVFSTGCATTNYDENQMLAMYYGQQRTYEPFAVKGAQEIIFRAPEGETVEMKVANPLDPLGQYQQPKSIAQSSIETVGELAKYGIVAYAATECFNSLADTKVVKPQVVQPQVVRPDIVVVE